jgi:hypothetical protein
MVMVEFWEEEGEGEEEEQIDEREEGNKGEGEGGRENDCGTMGKADVMKGWRDGWKKLKEACRHRLKG